MNKITLFTLLSFLSIATFAQTDSLQIVEMQKNVSSLQNKVTSLENSVRNLRQENAKLKSQNQEQSLVLDELKSAQAQQAANVQTLADKLGADITTTNTKIDDNVASLNNSISSKTLWAYGGLALAIVLLVVVFVVLRKKINSSSSSIGKIKAAQDSLEAAQKAMQEESVKLDSKLVGLLDKQVAAQSQTSGNAEPDHSLALKVADEIVRIETNLAHMDESVKGYKQLTKAVERIRTNFLANGYEIVEMLGKPYNEGMKASVSFETDETLADGEQKITGIIKPQINYQGKMIQTAQIKVSQNI